jgi:hypothetical protein
MLLPESDISCESSKVLEEYVFGIHDKGLIFEILRTKIYKDPISAIVREISSNSRDAHREISRVKNNTDLALVPIEIILPNTLSPYIKFRDYGPGISPDRMENVFCNYTASTKRNDNFQTGGFGLGCKTPFSYSDSFSIITVIDGVKRVYNAVIDETRVGKVMLIGESSTDDRNGTTIIVPVKREDNNKFIESVIRTTQYWDVRPILSGINPAPKFEDEKKVLEGNGWYLAAGKTDYYGYSTTRHPLALVDGIQYELDIDSLYEYNDRYGDDDASNGWTLLQAGIRINFNVGELTLAASRDNIHFDDKTKKTIKDRVEKIFKEIISTLETKLASCKTYTEACISAISANAELPNSIMVSAGKMNWNGHKLISGLSANLINPESTVAQYQRKQNAPDGTFTFTGSRKYKNGILSWPLSYSTGKNKILVNDYSDQKPGTTARISRIQIQHLFNSNSDVDTIEVLSMSPESKGKNVGDLFDLLGFESLSDIEITKEERDAIRKEAFNSLRRGTNAEKDPDKVSGYSIGWGRRGGVDLITPVQQFDIDEEGTYVVLEKPAYGGRIIKSNDKEISHYTFSDLRTFLELDEKSIIAFSPQNAKKLGDGWRTLYDVAKEKADEMIKDLDENKVKEALNTDRCYSRMITIFAEGYLHITQEDLQKNTKIDKTDCLIKYMDLSDEYDKLKIDMSQINRLLEFLGMKFDTTNTSTKKSEIDKLYTECNTKYPFLFILDGYKLRYNPNYNTSQKGKNIIYNYVDMANV